MPDIASPIRVFLSYSLDNELHQQNILKLAQRLRNDGIDAWIDQFTPFPAEGWPRWMEQQIAQAQFVVIIVTETYARRFGGKEPAGAGAGATWEGLIVTQKLYEANGRNDKFVPAIFAPGDKAYIPTPLRQFSYYKLFDNDGYDLLFRHLTGQAAITPLAVGPLRAMPGTTGVTPSEIAAQQTPAPLPSLEVYKHVAARSTLPRLPYGFFGREDELRIVSKSLLPNARSWGILIDGPGGIGKTALAIRPYGV